MKGIEDMPEHIAKKRLVTLAQKMETSGNEALAIFNEWGDPEKVGEACKMFDTLLKMLRECSEISIDTI